MEHTLETMVAWTIVTQQPQELEVVAIRDSTVMEEELETMGRLDTLQMI